MENELKIDWQQIDDIIAKYNANHEALLMIMSDINEIYNYVPQEVVPVLVDRLGVKESMIYSVATFYKTISLHPRGKHIVSVCTGTACHVRGAVNIVDALEEKLNIKEGETTEDKLFTLEAVRCIGCCAAGPVVLIDKETHGDLDRSGALEIIDEYKRRAS